MVHSRNRASGGFTEASWFLALGNGKGEDGQKSNFSGDAEGWDLVFWLDLISLNLRRITKFYEDSLLLSTWTWWEIWLVFAFRFYTFSVSILHMFRKLCTPRRFSTKMWSQVASGNVIVLAKHWHHWGTTDKKQPNPTQPWGGFSIATILYKSNHEKPKNSSISYMANIKSTKNMFFLSLIPWVELSVSLNSGFSPNHPLQIIH